MRLEGSRVVAGTIVPPARAAQSDRPQTVRPVATTTVCVSFGGEPKGHAFKLTFAPRLSSDKFDFHNSSIAVVQVGPNAIKLTDF